MYVLVMAVTCLEMVAVTLNVVTMVQNVGMIIKAMASFFCSLTGLANQIALIMNSA